MWKYCLSCLISAVLGGLVAVQLLDSRPLIDEAVAQEFAPRAGKRPNHSPPRPVLPAPEAPLGAPAPNGPGGHGPGAHGPVPHLDPLLDRPWEDGGLTPEERVNVAVYEMVNRSVVHITIRGTRETGLFALEVPTEGSGSGSIIDHQGNILTNNHVIEGARQVQVTLYDGKSYEAKYVGADPVNDVAVIRIDAPPEVLHPVEFGDSRPLKVGMRVYAIGNPFGLERTLTTGVISSLNRTLQVHENRTIKSIIQIDAAINPGNSGGPLLDSHGRLIGINTAIASKTGQSAGVGFAVPISTVARIVPQLLDRGRVTRPEIGIAKVFETERGLLIYRLAPNGPAERAGLRGPQVVSRRRGPFVVESEDKSAADLIVGIDGEPVKTADDFLSYIEAKRPGDRVVVTVIRGGKELQLPLVLGGEQ
ncbi:MAG: S1C family serine protease [Planctomycetaceae bacterium]